MTSQGKKHEKERPVPAASGSRPPVLNSRELFRDGPRIEIEHQGEIYRLQITRLGRLILTK
ncbi:MAG: hemin uptake protein HemP [Gammaproteobacteria bacterium]|nr:hemin uptake protein HemP [Gammaproteobacteria bacterium]MCP5317927.1 hemin uptake protein HemP [Chromatiaceae bacterium]MCW5587350.1 hemin uptake protein HemP [Chromatiales bacterium]MCB1818670.1 hemin uptake protein HemP [Gammaproteobacteria bacterium]MCP5429059.1 hemin uptake protein HemP [Chromatiaceae bacterium]